jgi:hypothetical protein
MVPYHTIVADVTKHIFPGRSYFVTHFVPHDVCKGIVRQSLVYFIAAWNLSLLSLPAVISPSRFPPSPKKSERGRNVLLHRSLLSDHSIDFHQEVGVVVGCCRVGYQYYYYLPSLQRVSKLTNFFCWLVPSHKQTTQSN